jgi:hypothetical protein
MRNAVEGPQVERLQELLKSGIVSSEVHELSLYLVGSEDLPIKALALEALGDCFYKGGPRLEKDLAKAHDHYTRAFDLHYPVALTGIADAGHKLERIAKKICKFDELPNFRKMFDEYSLHKHDEIEARYYEYFRNKFDGTERVADTERVVDSAISSEAPAPAPSPAKSSVAPVVVPALDLSRTLGRK